MAFCGIRGRAGNVRLGRRFNVTAFENMGKFLSRIWAFATRHKYLFVLGVFLVFIVFFDENSVVQRLQYEAQISELESEIQKYQAEYDKATRYLNELESDSGVIERIAREKYLMKKPNEDIYVFKD